MDSVLDENLVQLAEFIKKNLRSAPSAGGFSPEVQRLGRELAERLAVSMQASIMVRFGDPKVRSYIYIENVIASKISRYGV